VAKTRVQCKLKVSNVNVRMEMAGRDERGNLGVDISLTGAIHLEQVGKLLNDVHANAMLEALFDAEGGLKTPSFTGFTVGTVIKDCTVKLGEGELQVALKDSEINNIALVPAPGRQFEIKARLQTNPNPDQQSTIEFELLKDTVKVIIEGGERVNEDDAQEEMPLEGGDKPAGDEQEEPEEEEAEEPEGAGA
jgi:hypothetical protein